MATQLPEIFIQRALVTHLRAQGFQVREEVLFGSSRLDAVAYNGEKIVGFEVKLSSWARALEQTRIYKLCCDEVYLAVPMRSLTIGLGQRCLSAHVGLVAIGPPPSWDYRNVIWAPSLSLPNPLHRASIERIAAFT